MLIFVNFDIVLVVIFITIFITGYIRGGGIELLRVLRVIIPFFVLYFYGDEITNRLFSSEKIVEIVYSILPNIPYRNTIAALSTQIGVYIVVYLFLAIFLWRLGKYVLDERIEYLFGRLNSILGGIFSVIRMYIIVSIFIIPFYALNFTNNDYFLTSFILDNPPSFSKVGRLIEKAKPTLDKLNEISAALKVMDMENLNKYSSMLADVNDFIESRENSAYEVYHYLKTNSLLTETFTDKQSFMKYYVANLDYFSAINILDSRISEINHNINQDVKNYYGAFVFYYEKGVKETKTLDDTVNSFIANYPYLSANARDNLTIDILAKIKLQTQVYTSVKTWLVDNYHIEINNDFELLNDENLELVLDNFHLHKGALIESINRIDAKSSEKETIIRQIEKLANLQTEYLTVYKPLINKYDELLEGVSFKYKLAFSIMKEKKLNAVFEEKEDNDSLLYLFVLDSIEFLDNLSNDETVYYQAGKVYVSLFLINFTKVGEELVTVKITCDDIVANLSTFTDSSILFENTLTDINKLLRTLLIKRENGSYLEFLYRNGYTDETIFQDMLNSDALKDIINYENRILLKDLQESVSDSND